MNELRKLNYAELSEEYRGLLVERLHDFDVPYKKTKKMNWEKLELLYNGILAKQVRYASSPEPCIHCGFPYRKKFAYSRCPRCGK